MRRLQLGCGNKPWHYCINLDKYKLFGVDVVHDLEKTPLPFKTNEFDEVHAYHVLEHIHNFFPLMDEIWRILKPNGEFYLKVPHAFSLEGMTHPDHKRHFTFGSFIFFRKDYWENHYGKARFDFKVSKIGIIREKLGFPPKEIRMCLKAIK